MIVDVNVLCSSITLRNPQQQKNEGDSVTFSCRVDANPIDNKTITWGRVKNKNFDFGDRTVFSHDGKGTFNMTINKVRKSDRGKFFCEADNNLPGSVKEKKEMVLRVNCKFIIFSQLGLNQHNDRFGHGSGSGQENIFPLK